jgi:SagB-type dehydrogenase family enzyme
MEEALEAAKERLDLERREQFLSFGIPLNCYWPASRLYHLQSVMGPATKFRMTIEEAEAFTLNLDYKRYPGAPRMALPRPKLLSASFESLIRERHSERMFSRTRISLPELAKLLELGCGVTKDQEVPRRAAPSPGGLYAVETYPIALSVDSIAPGVYHYVPLNHALELVRPVPGIDIMKGFLPPDLFDAGPTLALAFSVVFPRVQTKYLERGYRFALLEAGHIAQNVLLAATALHLNSVPVGGFWDEPFNDLMGFEGTSEAVVYSILLGHVP